jgi:peptide/nickel transport system permease protein
VTVGYVLRRFGLFALVIFAAVTINFMMPRIRSTNPVEQRLYELAAQGGVNVGQMKEMVAAYDEKFGFNKPVLEQYINYWKNLLVFDLGASITFYPASVRDMILRTAPWTIGLLAVSTIIAFSIGSIFGALMAWPKTSNLTSGFSPIFMVLSAIPYYLLGMILIYCLALVWPVLPAGGAYTTGSTPTLTLESALDIGRHAILPAASIVLASIGFWGLGMRAMMVTTLGEDYMVMAESKGLRQRTMFFNYGLRNALLPQITSLAIVLAHIMSGAVLVEVIFAYPGVGQLLFRAISGNDYFLIQGIVLFIILSIGVVLLVVDLIYPLIDPRIRYKRG